MDTIFKLAALAIAISLGMVIMRPLLKERTGTEEVKIDRWKMLWRRGTICWFVALVLVQAFTYLHSQVKEIEQKNTATVQQIKQTGGE